jgi:hypothetical protein
MERRSFEISFKYSFFLQIAACRQEITTTKTLPLAQHPTGSKWYLQNNTFVVFGYAFQPEYV